MVKQWLSWLCSLELKVVSKLGKLIRAKPKHHTHTHRHTHKVHPGTHTPTHTHTHTCRVRCYANGNNYTYPQLFLNNEPIDAQYIETSSLSEVTLFVSYGIKYEGLVGYYTCRTQNNSFTTSSILHSGEFQSLYMYIKWFRLVLLWSIPSSGSFYTYQA